jgi:hypothetical protein
MERTLLSPRTGASTVRKGLGQALARRSQVPSPGTASTRPAHCPGGHAAGDTFCANPLPAAARARAATATTSCAASTAVAKQTTSGAQALAARRSPGPVPRYPHSAAELLLLPPAFSAAEWPPVPAAPAATAAPAAPAAPAAATLPSLVTEQPRAAPDVGSTPDRQLRWQGLAGSARAPTASAWPSSKRPRLKPRRASSAARSVLAWGHRRRSSRSLTSWGT